MDIDILKLTKKHVTLHVRIRNVGQLRIRLWMAKVLIRLATRLASMQLDFDEEVGVLTKNANYAALLEEKP